jgi:RNA polymerase sigma-70 factor (ECF subfamily)
VTTHDAEKDTAAKSAAAQSAGVDAAVADPFTAARPRLMALAYRMLGSIGDAEDAVQETYIRWHGADRAAIRTPAAWLTTACTRICIDRLRKAKAERAAYIGTWLPEPVAIEPPEDEALGESLSLAFLVMLERLSPPERAAYLLHDVFESDYAAVAAALGKSEQACRQLVSRARRSLNVPEDAPKPKPRYAADPAHAEELATAFVAAARAGDAKRLMAMLAADAELWSDGGGKAAAALNVIHGADRITRFLVGIRTKQDPGLELVYRLVNGRPGIVGYVGPCADFALALEPGEGGRIAAVYIVRNPDKLARLALH